jgi:hypothetical protein
MGEEEESDTDQEKKPDRMNMPRATTREKIQCQLTGARQKQFQGGEDFPVNVKRFVNEVMPRVP